jgi:hypothetical protein
MMNIKRYCLTAIRENLAIRTLGGETLDVVMAAGRLAIMACSMRAGLR